MKDHLLRELYSQKTNTPNYISELTERAAQEILRLRAQIERIHSDRQYIIGFSDGYDCAVEQSQPQVPTGPSLVKSGVSNG